MAIALRTTDAVRLVYAGDECVDSDYPDDVWIDYDQALNVREGATIVEVMPLDALTFRRVLSHDDELENERALIEAAVQTVDGKGFDQHGVDAVCELFGANLTRELSALAVAVIEVSTGKSGRLSTSR